MSVSYLQWKLLDGSFCTRIVMSRSKIAPLSKITLPRLELLSALMNVRLSNAIKERLMYNISRTIHIVDSSIVLEMIRTHSVCYGEFVGTRIAEIQRLSDVNDWYWVASADNAADIGTRRHVKTLELCFGSQWQCGPEWLSLSFESWPVSQTFERNSELPEMKSKYLDVVHNLSSGESSYSDIVHDISVNLLKSVPIINNYECNAERLFNIESYSNITKLLRVTLIY